MHTAHCFDLFITYLLSQVVQPDRYTLSLRLRTPLSQGWLHLSWHPLAARVCMGAPPVRGAVSEAFSFVEQVGPALLLLMCTTLEGAVVGPKLERGSMDDVESKQH